MSTDRPIFALACASVAVAFGVTVLATWAIPAGWRALKRAMGSR